jgi:L-amino acid N-acyltransferase YncA
LSNPVIRLTPLEPRHLAQCLAIWNEIVDEGISFPCIEPFTKEQLLCKFKAGEPVLCAVDAQNTVLGLCHIPPNNEGRCAHIANCGYMVSSSVRGQGVGRLLVRGSLDVAREMGFMGVQFNAVVSTNAAAIALYQSEGFKIIGTVPRGFLQKDGHYVDMHIMYREL